jgi:hypothetical protein
MKNTGLIKNPLFQMRSKIYLDTTNNKDLLSAKKIFHNMETGTSVQAACSLRLVASLIQLWS